MDKIAIDIFSALSGAAIIYIFFSCLWEVRKTRIYLLISGVILLLGVNVLVAPLLAGSIYILLIYLVLILFISFSFYSTIQVKILYTLLMAAIMFLSEILMALIFVNILLISLATILENIMYYFISAIASNLISLILVLVAQILLRSFKKEASHQFNYIMLFMPIQTIVVCYMVYRFTINSYEVVMISISFLAILLSFIFIIITFFLAKSFQEATQNKLEHEISKERLSNEKEMQKQLYKEHDEIRKISHDIKDNMYALLGSLNANQIDKAKAHVESLILKNFTVTPIWNTGVPELDSVLNYKYAKAKKAEIEVKGDVDLPKEFLIDPFDLTIIIANALDNAIEGIERSSNVKKQISFSIKTQGSFIFISTKNHASGSINEKFQTSKKNKTKHGFGMANMKAITDKYSGRFNPVYDNNNKLFSLTIMLQNGS